MHCDFYGRIAVSVSFLRNQTDDAINYSILFLKAEENTRFADSESKAFYLLKTQEQSVKL